MALDEGTKRGTNINERSRGHCLLPGHETFSTSKVGGWWLVVGGDWRLMVSGGWRGGWWLAIGGWWGLAHRSLRQGLDPVAPVGRLRLGRTPAPPAGPLGNSSTSVHRRPGSPGERSAPKDRPPVRPRLPRLAVGGACRLAVGSGWWLAVGGPCGQSLRAVLNLPPKKEISDFLKPPPPPHTLYYRPPQNTSPSPMTPASFLVASLCPCRSAAPPPPTMPPLHHHGPTPASRACPREGVVRVEGARASPQVL